MQGIPNRRISSDTEPASQPRATVSSSVAAAQRWPQGPLQGDPPGVRTGIRPWQYTPHYPFVDSRLDVAVCRQTLIVSCKTLTDASHVQGHMVHTALLFAFIIAVNLMVMLQSGPENGHLSQVFPVTFILVVYLIYSIARGLVRSLLKPQLLISPQGWSVSYCSFGRVDLWSAVRQNLACCGNQDFTNQEFMHSPGGSSSNTSDDVTLTLGGANLSPKAPNEACIAVDTGATSSHCPACIHTALDDAWENVRGAWRECAACRDKACITCCSAQYNAAQSTCPCPQCPGRASPEAGGVQEVGGISGAGMHGASQESSGGSDGPLPASKDATNCAMHSSSLASISAAVHDHNAGMDYPRETAGAEQLGYTHGPPDRGWLESVVHTCMELCGRGESLADEAAWEPVIGAKVRNPRAESLSQCLPPIVTSYSLSSLCSSCLNHGKPRCFILKEDCRTAFCCRRVICPVVQTRMTSLCCGCSGSGTKFPPPATPRHCTSAHSIWRTPLNHFPQPHLFLDRLQPT